MVKAALKPHYRAKQIDKDQYTNINKRVSRKMYDMVGSAAALSDQAERERFQGVANEEVRQLVLASAEFGFTNNDR